MAVGNRKIKLHQKKPTTFPRQIVKKYIKSIFCGEKIKQINVQSQRLLLFVVQFSAKFHTSVTIIWLKKKVQDKYFAINSSVGWESKIKHFLFIL